MPFRSRQSPGLHRTDPEKVKSFPTTHSATSRFAGGAVFRADSHEFFGYVGASRTHALWMPLQPVYGVFGMLDGFDAAVSCVPLGGFKPLAELEDALVMAMRGYLGGAKQLVEPRAFGDLYFTRTDVPTVYMLVESSAKGHVDDLSTPT